MADACRAGGLTPGDAWCHVLPSHVQVSPKSCTTVDPPKSTTVPLVGSAPIAAPSRGEGLVAGACRVQVLPSHVQVSPRSPLAEPPNSTTLAVDGSVAAAAAPRGEGLNAGLRWVQRTA